MKKYILYVFLILALTTCVSIFRPVPIVTEDKAIAITGTVDEIYATGDYDIFFRLEDDDRRFYINRGQQQGLDIENLNEKLRGKEITLKYPKYWTPLDWNNSIRHLSKVEFNNEVIFNELK